MLGAIIGDLAGSIDEYSEFKDSLKKTINLKRRLERLHKKELIDDNSFYSDDTILTIAILDAIINNELYETKLKEYGLKYKDEIPKNIDYFEYMFSPGFIKWCKSNEPGTSIGNGSAMRISSVGYLFNDEETVLKEAKKATIPSHNSKEAVDAASAVALLIYLARKGLNKEQIKEIISTKFNYKLDYDLEELRKIYLFDSTYKVVPLCIYISLSSNSFEESIRKAISIGGDTDTIACITGSISEALFGIPDKYIDKVYKKLPNEFVKLLKIGYKRI